MSGRARNKPYKRRGHGAENPPEGRQEDSEVAGALGGSAAEEVLHCGPVPRIRMDYFYENSGGTVKSEANGMTTKVF